MVNKQQAKTRKKNIHRVLVVEDDPVLALDLEAALLDIGAVDVVICPSMSATMAELDRARPDAIILDVHLADRDDGWALAELVSLLGPKPPRVAFSTGAPEEIPAKVRAMGPVFEKPCDPMHIAREIMCENPRTGLISRLRGALRH